MISIQEKGDVEVARLHLAKSSFFFRKGIREALFEVGSENRKHLSKKITTGIRTGKHYPFRGRLHRASAPGEPPASMTGRLARTTRFKVRGFYQCEFGDTAYYGAFLEKGTKYMAPRPHVLKTVEEKRKDNLRSLTDHVSRKLNKK